MLGWFTLKVASQNIQPIAPQESLPEIPRSKVLSVNEDNVFQIIDLLISLESQGKRGAVNPKDVDGRPKFGELQYDIITWNGWEKKFGFYGDPMIRGDAITMTRLALFAGYGYRWGTWKKVVETLGNE